jgi:hypothetical protein
MVKIKCIRVLYRSNTEAHRALSNKKSFIPGQAEFKVTKFPGGPQRISNFCFCVIGKFLEEELCVP